MNNPENQKEFLMSQFTNESESDGSSYDEEDTDENELDEDDYDDEDDDYDDEDNEDDYDLDNIDEDNNSENIYNYDQTDEDSMRLYNRSSWSNQFNSGNYLSGYNNEEEKSPDFLSVVDSSNRLYWEQYDRNEEFYDDIEIIDWYNERDSLDVE